MSINLDNQYALTISEASVCEFFQHRIKNILMVLNLKKIRLAVSGYADAISRNTCSNTNRTIEMTG